jgi:hypothetical protein
MGLLADGARPKTIFRTLAKSSLLYSNIVDSHRHKIAPQQLLALLAIFNQLYSRGGPAGIPLAIAVKMPATVRY